MPRASNPRATKANTPVPRALTPTTVVRTREEIFCAKGLLVVRGLAAKLPAMDVVRKYSAVARPPAIAEPLMQLKGDGRELFASPVSGAIGVVSDGGLGSEFGLLGWSIVPLVLWKADFQNNSELTVLWTLSLQLVPA